MPALQMLPCPGLCCHVSRGCFPEGLPQPPEQSPRPVAWDGVGGSHLVAQLFPFSLCPFAFPQIFFPIFHLGTGVGRPGVLQWDRCEARVNVCVGTPVLVCAGELVCASHVHSGSLADPHLPPETPQILAVEPNIQPRPSFHQQPHRDVPTMRGWGGAWAQCPCAVPPPWGAVWA